MRVFATLGPSGSNHELVTERYIEFHNISDAQVALVTDFDDAVEMVLRGDADHIVQVAVHPDTAAVVAKTRTQLFLIDSFIAPSKPLAVVTRRGVSQPRSLGLQPATRDYVDHTRWSEHVPETSIVTVGEGLLAGRYDSGITALELAHRHPDELVIDEVIGTVDDVWLVYGRERTCEGEILAWRESPAAAIYRR
ncbi:MAG: hypothetical protein AAF493_12030 [Pseudomonadota bacterium]